jgi:lysophospholipase L1-like esterase
MTQWRWPWSAKRAAQAPRPLALEELENRNLLSIAVGALGDSITAPYQGGPKGVGGDRSWAELLQTLRAPEGVTVANVAHNGATSAMLLAQGQHTKIAELVAAGEVNSALLFIGVNDATVNLGGIVAGNPGPFVQTVVNDVTTVLGTLTQAGPVHLVVANIPDTGMTPLIQGMLGYNPASLQELTGAIAQANQQIDAVAAAYHVPVIDLFDFSHLTRTPLTLGGTQVTRFLAPDAWHPGTVTQGLIANAFLAALNIGYGTDISGLPLSDQEILTAAGIGHAPGTTYFDVSRLVLWNQGQVPASAPAEVSSPTPVAAAAPQFPWAGFGQVLHAGKAEVSEATAPAAGRGTASPALDSQIASADSAWRSVAIAGAALAVSAPQATEVSADLLDAFFAEADAAFFTNADRL